jgi:arsenate reductase
MAAGQIAERIGLPAPTLSFHLAQLKNADLASQRREGRSIIYTANFAGMTALVTYLTENCCQGDPAACGLAPAAQSKEQVMTKHAFNVLFLCTGNSARSIMAEALIDHWGKGRFRGFSAGSFPKGQLHPRALRLLEKLGMPLADARSKSWDEFAAPGAPVMDFVFTVCDQAAGEVCPIWPGHPMTAHWGVPDPAAVEGGEAAEAAAFRDAFKRLESRIKVFTALPFQSLDRLTLKRKVDEIGRATDGAKDNAA